MLAAGVAAAPFLGPDCHGALERPNGVILEPYLEFHDFAWRFANGGNATLSEREDHFNRFFGEGLCDFCEEACFSARQIECVHTLWGLITVINPWWVGGL